MKIKFLGTHMFESTDTRLSCLLIDDIMAVDAGGLTSGLSFEDQEKIRFIVLTHGHYDHIRDIAPFALKNQGRTTDIYATDNTLDILTTHLINGTVYPRFTEFPSPEKPALKLNTIEPYIATKIGDYTVMALPVPHAIPAVGYEITSKQGKSVFFSGDTGPGLESCWERISPHMIIMDMSYSNRSKEKALKPGHLCPDLLKVELSGFQQTKGYLPHVIMTHIDPREEDTIKQEARQLAAETGTKISVAHEGMTIQL